MAADSRAPGEAPRSGSEVGKLPYPLIFLAWACLLLWPAVLHPGQPLIQPKSQFSDLLISHWPNAEFLRRSLFEFHQFPLWNPSILGGAPFAADPLAGVWYLPNWLTVILPLPFAFNLLLVFHLAWAAWGMYRWARADGFGVLPSFIGGLAYAGMPKIIDHIGAGHISLVYAVCWMPWLLEKSEVTRSGQKSEASKFVIRHSSFVALIWAMVFLADVRWGVYAGAVMIVWWFTRHRPRLALGGLVLCGVLSVMLTAALWLPMLEFVQHSSRVGLTLEEAGAFSLPARYLVGLLIPDVGGFQEYMTYLGIAPLVLAIIGAVNSRDRVGIIAVVTLMLFSIWWALGPGAGLFTIVARLPGVALLRVPSRAWFIVGLSVSWLAVRGAATVESGWRLAGRNWNLASMGMITALWVLAIGGSAVAKKPIVNLFITAVAVTGVLIALRVKPALAALAAMAAIELLWVNSTFIESRPVVRSPVAEWLADQAGVWRVYSPSYSLPQLDAAQLGLEQADGVNPLQLADTVAFMESATGVKRAGYSVTVPPFRPHGEGDVDIATANADAAPDTRLLGQMNVRFVLSEFDIQSEGLELRAQIGNTRIYENRFDAGRVQGGSLVAWSPNRIVVVTDGSRRVTLSEVWYPGWVGNVDGVPAEVYRHGIFRSQMAGSGSHRVVFQFQPTIVYVGVGLSFLGLVIALFVLRFTL